MSEQECRNLIRYFRACYQADNRYLNLFNVYGRNCEYTRLMSGQEELVTGFLPRLPLPRTYAQELSKAVRTYQREKSLFYGSFFIIGKLPSSYPGNKKVCAPLIYYPALIEQDKQEYYLTIARDKPIINWPLLKWMQGEAKKRQEPKFVFQGITDKDVAKLSHWITGLTKEINCLELYHYPKLSNASYIEEKQNNAKEGKFQLISAACLTLVKQSLASRGTLHELTKIRKSESLSIPLRQTLNYHLPYINSAKPARPENIPGLLSRAQSKALFNANEYAVSQIVGPPGTGKSYTIACIALERYLQGESVLILSQTDEAIEVIQTKLAALIGQKDFIVRAGAASQQSQLKKYLLDLLSGFTPLEQEGRVDQRAVSRQKAKIFTLEQTFLKRCKKAIRHGKFTHKALKHPGLLNRFKGYIAKRDAHNNHSLFTQFDKICQENRIREKMLANFINGSRKQQLSRVLKDNREHLQHYSKAIRARNSSSQESHFDNIDYNILLQALPVWLCNLGELHRSLPLKRELFDLVIIDEATQCDMATAIPALYRAKRAVVVGDPKQLKFVSFLSRDKEQKLQKKFDLGHLPPSYRDNSLMEQVNSAIKEQAAIVMLDEHFRSKPELIQFSNKKFYNQQLKLMRQKPAAVDDNPIELIFCDGVYNNGKNRSEAQAVLAKLNSILQSYERQGITPSIGILSPFREQVQILNKLLTRHIYPDKLEKHQIRVDTPYGFQGDERDIMLISFCVDPESSGHAYQYMNRADVFNVAITRARDALYLFLSAPPHRLKSGTLLFDYIHSCERAATFDLSEDTEFDAFQGEVCRILTLNGVNTWKNYPIAGAEMDIACQYGDKLLAIDLIGYPGESQQYYHLERYKLFQRTGITLFPLAYSSWVYQRQRTLQQLLALLVEENDLALSSDINIF